MEHLLTATFNSLSLSSIILLTSIGLTITFGLMKVINMAHGEFVMIGAYMTFVIQQIFKVYLPADFLALYYLTAIPMAFLVAFCLGSFLEKFVISNLYGREIDSLLATFGVSIILQQLVRTIFGAQGVNVEAPAFLNGGLELMGMTFSYNRLFIIALVLCSLFMLWFVMFKMNYGKQMRAVMQHRAMAQCIGINSRKIDNFTFSLGSGLAGIAGCSVALLGSIDSTIGQSYIVNSFMAVVLGGVGKIVGTILASMMIGFTSIFTENYTSSSIAKAIVLLLVISILQKRPQGLFIIKNRSLDD